MNRQIDLTGILHSVKVPTLIFHLTEDAVVSVEGGRELAAGIPGAKLVEMPGTDHLLFLEAGDRLLEEMEEFVTGSHSSCGISMLGGRGNQSHRHRPSRACGDRRRKRNSWLSF
jgi:hypothetical protein